MQGELEKTIEAIDGVASATVNLTIPPDQVFAGAQADAPSAAVLVQPAGGTTLSSDAVQAIVHLVASSIPNMTPDAVTVADSSGNVLNAPGMDLSSSQGLEQQTSFDTALGTAVSTLPRDRARPEPRRRARAVRHELRPDRRRRASRTDAGRQRWQADPGAAEHDDRELQGPGERRHQRRARRHAGTPARPPAAATETYSKTTNQTTNALDQVETEVQQAPGKINRLSVAVLLDSSVVKPADVANWTKQIQAAVGYDAKRGDVVQVTPVPFSTAAQKAAKAAAERGVGIGLGDSMLDLVRNIVTLLIVALVLFFAWRAIKKAEANRVPLRVPLDLRELEAADTRALESVGATPRLAELDRRALAPAADTGVEGELTDLIEHQPDEVAQTLRSWLADRRT